MVPQNLIAGMTGPSIIDARVWESEHFVATINRSGLGYSDIVFPMYSTPDQIEGYAKGSLDDIRAVGTPPLSFFFSCANMGPQEHAAADRSAGTPTRSLLAFLWHTFPDACVWPGARNNQRPLIMCEYAHAMGNSCGGLQQY